MWWLLCLYVISVQGPTSLPRASMANKLALMQSLYLEAGPTMNKDWWVIPFVLKRRWHVLQVKMGNPDLGFYQAVYAYSVPTNPRHRHYSCGRAGGKRRAFCAAVHRRRWLDYPAPHRLFVEAWFRGEVRDACPLAGHWGSRSDGNPRQLERVYCGRTKNIFYR